MWFIGKNGCISIRKLQKDWLLSMIILILLWLFWGLLWLGGRSRCIRCCRIGDRTTTRLNYYRLITPKANWDQEHADSLGVEHILLELKLVEWWQVHFVNQIILLLDIFITQFIYLTFSIQIYFLYKYIPFISWIHI